MLSEVGKMISQLPVSQIMIDRIKELQPGAIYVPGYALDHPIHTTPNVYIQNKLKALMLWIDYTIEWKDFQRRRKDNFALLLELGYKLSMFPLTRSNTATFTWMSGGAYQIKITTTFTDTDQDQPMCFEEFCMWIAMQYHFQIAL